MTARDTLLWFGIGVPIACLLLILLDTACSPNRGRFVPRRPVDIAPDARQTAAMAPSAASADPDAEFDPQVEPEAEPDAVHVVRTVPAVHALVASLRPPRPAHKPWAPGDGLRRPITGGTAPSAATVRKRAWTTYSVIAPRDIFGVVNAERLERGRPPLRFNPMTESVEPMQIDVDEVGRVRVHWTDADDTVDPYEITRTR